MRRDKPWFGPIPSIGKAVCPRSWEGCVVTLAFLLGMGLLRLEADPNRRAIALALLVVAYAAVVALTWGDPDSDDRPGWRETLFNARTLAWLAFLLVLAAAGVAAGLYGCAGCGRVLVR